MRVTASVRLTPNPIFLNDSIPSDVLISMMDLSYTVVIEGLPQDQQDRLVARHGQAVIHKAKRPE